MLYLGFRFVECLVWRGALDIVLETVGVFLRNFVGGIVMMIAGGNAKEIVGRVKERVEEINSGGAIPRGLKIVPYYDRSDLVDAALHTVRIPLKICDGIS